MFVCLILHSGSEFKREEQKPPATLLKFHKALVKRKHHLFNSEFDKRIINRSGFSIKVNTD